MADAVVTSASGGEWRLRPASVQDAPFLREMLLEACNWDGRERTTEADLSGDPHVIRYVAGWGREGDTGVVAVDRSGVRVGAAWVRRLRRPDHGYGHVADDIPELSIAVVRRARGRGVGRALIAGLVDRLALEGRPGVSLSVEDGNVAISLYRSCGFRPVGRNGASTTMLLDLGAGTHHSASQHITGGKSG